MLVQPSPDAASGLVRTRAGIFVQSYGLLGQSAGAWAVDVIVPVGSREVERDPGAETWARPEGVEVGVCVAQYRQRLLGAATIQQESAQRV
jgi:hypothetical protein